MLTCAPASGEPLSSRGARARSTSRSRRARRDVAEAAGADRADRVRAVFAGAREHAAFVARSKALVDVDVGARGRAPVGFAHVAFEIEAERNLDRLLGALAA